MSKIFAILLCLILALWNIPQTNLIFAADPFPCSQIGIETKISYNLNNQLFYLNKGETIPEGISAVYFEISGPLENGVTYQLDFSNGKTNAIEATNGKVDYLTASEPNLLSTIPHFGKLMKIGTTLPFCTGIDYQVGNKYSDRDCRIKLSSDPDSPAINQSISATVQHAPAKTYSVIYSTNDFLDKNKTSDKRVTIDRNGDGVFTFYTGNVPLQKAEISLEYALFEPSTGTNIPIMLCRRSFDITPVVPPSRIQCTIIPDPSEITVFKDVSVNVTNANAENLYQAILLNQNNINNPGSAPYFKSDWFAANRDGTVKIQLNKPPQKLAEDNYILKVLRENITSVCSKEFSVKANVAQVNPVVKKCGEKDDKDKVIECSKGGGDSCDTKDGRGPAFQTAIGCIHTNPPEFVKDLMKFIIGIGGGLAFLMMLLGAYQMLSSAGNPETLKAGQDRLTSAVTGLLFIIFAVLLLQIIGVDILAIPGFGK